MKHLSVVLAVAGLVLGTVLVGWFGVGAIVHAMLSVGIWGFVAFCVWQALTMAELGVGWRVVAPLDRRWQVLPFMWGRMVRDSAGACLPFSPVGGFVFGARAATLSGISASVAALSMVVDLTAEFIAEILFAICGLLVLLAHAGHSSLTGPITLGLVAASGLGVAAVKWRKKTTAGFVLLGRRIMGKQFEALGEGSSASEQELAEIYGRGWPMLIGTAMHFVGWVFKGFGNWIAFRLLGFHLGIFDALAIEALLHVMLVPALVVPGYAGVQEAGYVGIGALFGAPPEVSLSVSLLRRARDIALGVPILLVWQSVEMQRLRNAHK